MLGWLTLFYLYCGFLIAAYFWIYRFIHRPKFRDEHGDITTEVGYEEDSIGKPLHGNDEEYVDPEVPHCEPIGQTEMGMLRVHFDPNGNVVSLFLFGLKFFDFVVIWIDPALLDLLALVCAQYRVKGRTASGSQFSIISEKLLPVQRSIRTIPIAKVPIEIGSLP